MHMKVCQRNGFLRLMHLLCMANTIVFNVFRIFMGNRNCS